MPNFSNSSKSKLATCHKDLQTLFNYVIESFDCTIICGHRGEAEQNEAYHKGYSTVKYPNSKHNSSPSNAVDAVPYPIEWENTARMKFFVGYVLGVARVLKNNGIIESEIISGLDWDGDTFLKDHTFQDHPHLQIKQ